MLPVCILSIRKTLRAWLLLLAFDMGGGKRAYVATTLLTELSLQSRVMIPNYHLSNKCLLDLNTYIHALHTFSVIQRKKERRNGGKCLVTSRASFQASSQTVIAADDISSS